MMTITASDIMKTQKPPLVVDRSKLIADTSTQFQQGNRAAAKPKWSDERIRKFQRELAKFREWLGFNHREMGEALGFSPSYCKLMEGGYPSTPLRRPSDEFLKRVVELKKSATPKPKFRTSRRARRRAQELWTHVLGKRFKCPECAREVKHGEREPGLEYWWAAVPGQKHCPAHQRRRK